MCLESILLVCHFERYFMTMVVFMFCSVMGLC